jgi:hypothetical protein
LVSTCRYRVFSVNLELRVEPVEIDNERRQLRNWGYRINFVPIPENIIAYNWLEKKAGY